MIERYTKPEMASVWTERVKFGLWVQSILAVLHAFVSEGKITAEQLAEVIEHVGFDVERVHELDRKFNHDAGALIETCREVLRHNGVSEDLVVHFGIKVTSYDMEDPAFSRMICNAIELSTRTLDSLIETVEKRTIEHKETVCAFLTHGQLAVPGLLGVRMTRWLAMLQRDRERFQKALNVMRVGKFSGAGGIFDELDPETEKAACDYLQLEVADGTSQIIHRDRHAEVMSVFAICASNIAQIANDLWLMCSYPHCEAREYFNPDQRGSTAMPHKRNPITLERLRGMSSLLRGYTVAALEQIVTFDERAIDQSCVERVIWPDATVLLHYMLVTFSVCFDKMVFFPGKMRQNLDHVQGIWGAQHIKNALWEKGITELPFMHPDGSVETLPVYKWVQACAFEYAWDADTNQPIQPLKNAVTAQKIIDYLSVEEVEQCFDLQYALRNAPKIYEKYGI